MDACRGSGAWTVYFGDHQPPHFHARSADGEALIAIDPIRVLQSSLSAREERAAVAWANENIELVRAKWAECNP